MIWWLMILLFLSFLLACLALHHACHPISAQRFDSAFFMLLVLALIIAAFPTRQFLFERKLAVAVEKLTQRDGVSVTCQSLLGSFFSL